MVVNKVCLVLACSLIDSALLCNAQLYDYYTTVFSSCEAINGDESLIGNGECDFVNNFENCDWDGGDCCECDCTDGTYECGSLGFNCDDPGSDCYGSWTFDLTDSIEDNDDDSTSISSDDDSTSISIDDDSTSIDESDDYSSCEAINGDESLIGNGQCDFVNNFENCDWDDGDCCECDCTDGTYECGSSGFNCDDPGSDCYGSWAFDLTDSVEDDHEDSAPTPIDNDDSVDSVVTSPFGDDDAGGGGGGGGGGNVGAIVGGTLAGLVVVGALVLAALFKIGRLKKCWGSSSNKAAAAADDLAPAGTQPPVTAASSQK